METSVVPLTDTVLVWCWCLGAAGVADTGDGCGLTGAGCGGVNASISGAKVTSKPGVSGQSSCVRWRAKKSCELTSLQIPLMRQENLAGAS